MFTSKKISNIWNSASAIPAKFTHKLKGLRENDEGIAAVEFAILSPIMIALYFGLVEIAMIINADKLTSHATNVAGDLATQVTNMDSNDVEDVFQAALASMSLRPEQVSEVGVEILSYRMNTDGSITELGKATLNGGYTGDAYNPEDIGERLLTVNSGAVVARVQYNYESVTFKFVESFTVLEETFILKPRSSLDIPFTLNDTYQAYNCTSSGSYEVSCSG